MQQSRQASGYLRSRASSPCAMAWLAARYLRCLHACMRAHTPEMTAHACDAHLHSTHWAAILVQGRPSFMHAGCQSMTQQLTERVAAVRLEERAAAAGGAGRCAFEDALQGRRSGLPACSACAHTQHRRSGSRFPDGAAQLHASRTQHVRRLAGIAPERVPGG